MKHITKVSIGLLGALSIAACTPPVIRMPETPGMQAFDQETEYVVTPSANGFGIKLRHAKVQYAPETGVVIAKCKDAALAIAHQYAEQQHRRIKAVSAERVTYTTDRDMMNGITSCTANLSVEWGEMIWV